MTPLSPSPERKDEHTPGALAERMADAIEQYIANYDRNEAQGRGALTLALIPLYSAVQRYREALESAAATAKAASR